MLFYLITSKKDGLQNRSQTSASRYFHDDFKQGYTHIAFGNRLRRRRKYNVQNPFIENFSQYNAQEENGLKNEQAMAEDNVDQFHAYRSMWE